MSRRHEGHRTLSPELQAFAMRAREQSLHELRLRSLVTLMVWADALQADVAARLAELEAEEDRGTDDGGP